MQGLAPPEGPHAATHQATGRRAGPRRKHTLPPPSLLPPLLTRADAYMHTHTHTHAHTRTHTYTHTHTHTHVRAHRACGWRGSYGRRFCSKATSKSLRPKSRPASRAGRPRAGVPPCSGVGASSACRRSVRPSLLPCACVVSFALKQVSCLVAQATEACLRAHASGHTPQATRDQRFAT